MNIFKSLFKSDKDKFDDITPETLEINRIKYSGGGYLKWLQNKNGPLQAAKIIREETKGSAPQEWIDKIKLIEEAIEKEKNNNI